MVCRNRPKAVNVDLINIWPFLCGVKELRSGQGTLVIVHDSQTLEHVPLVLDVPDLNTAKGSVERRFNVAIDHLHSHCHGQ